MSQRDIIVMGASWGGLSALSEILGSLPRDLPAAVFVVLHGAASAPGVLPALLARESSLPVDAARDGDAVESGRVLVAPPDRHLLLHRERVRLSAGPTENRCRPAIDPLFRSAAVAYRSRVIGVVLTGLLDDGSAGLRAVGRAGGVTVVQDPKSAEAPDMPRHAMEAAKVEHCVPLREIAPLLGDLSRQHAPEPGPLPSDIAAEARLLESALSHVAVVRDLGEPTANACPECGGPLWKVRDGPLRRFRCHIGHGFTEAGLLQAQTGESERALTVALRTLEERARMYASMAERARERGSDSLAGLYRGRARESEAHVGAIHALLEKLN